MHLYEFVGIFQHSVGGAGRIISIGGECNTRIYDRI